MGPLQAACLQLYPPVACKNVAEGVEHGMELHDCYLTPNVTLMFLGLKYTHVDCFLSFNKSTISLKWGRG